MALHKDFPKDPYTILDPSIRWFPADEILREKGFDKLIPPLVASLRKQVKEWRDKNATDMYLQLTDWDYFGMPAHAADIGVQLTRAEYAIKFGWEYSQDRGPNKM